MNMFFPHRLNYLLGHFTSFNEVWRSFPAGGHRGEYLYVLQDLYCWDEGQRNWLREDHHAARHLPRPAADLDIMGDLRVGGRAVFQQPAVFKRDVRVEGRLLCRHLQGRDCGLFATPEKLSQTVPSPHKGFWALVGLTASPQLWICETEGVWSNSMTTVALSESFSLEAYNAARDIVDDIASKGYVFCGVADPATIPHTPLDHQVFYLSSDEGVYIHFGGLHVRYLTALMWNIDPRLDGGGEWTAQVVLGHAFIQTENIADGAVTPEKTTGIMTEISALREQLEEWARQSASPIDLTDVRNDINGLQEDVGSLQTDVAGLQSDVSGLQGDVSSIQSGVAGLQSDVAGLQGDVSDLDDRMDTLQRTVAGMEIQQGAKFIPIVAVLSESPLIETSSLATHDDGFSYAYVWDNVRKLPLLRVLRGTSIQEDDTYLYYLSWNDQPTGLASSDIDKWKDFFYLTTGSLLTIYHWHGHEDTGNIVPTGSQGTAPSGDDPVQPVLPDAVKDYSADPQYPEYYGAKGDGIAYFDWPLACFGGVISNIGIVIDPEGADIEVSAPEERIVNDYGLTFAATAADVRYCAPLKTFLLKMGTVYYKTWLNASLWNDPVTGLARTDTIYSDISLMEGETEKAVRNSYLFRPAEGLVDILSTMTDDTTAVGQWLAANSGAGHTARLAPGRVYFINSLNSSSACCTVAANTTIEGNGATLFCRTTDGGRPTPGTELVCVCLRIRNAPDVTINNLCIKALKDRDGGTPAASYSRLSSSESNVYGMTIDNSPNTHINNLECKNLHCDIRFVQGEKVYVDGWKSTGVLNNGLGTTKTYINNADLTTAPYSAAGFHLFYGGAVNDEVYFSNCKFRSGSGYQEVMLSFHAAQGGTPEAGTTRHVYFDNCTIEAGAMLRGNNYGMHGRQWIHFHNCVMRKTFETQSNANQIVARNALLGLQTNSFEFDNCLIEIGYGSFIGSVSGGTENNLIIHDTSIYSKLASASVPLVAGYSGSVDTQRVWTNYPGPIGLPLDNDATQLRMRSMEDSIANIFLQLLGTDDPMPAYPSAPSTPAVGDKYYDTAVGKAYECTATGTPTRVSIRCNYALSGAPFTAQHTLAFNRLESVTFDFSNVTSVEEMEAVITTTLEEAGYTEGTGRLSSPGVYVLYASSDAHFLLVTSKQQGDFADSLSVSGMGDDKPFLRLYATWGSNAYQNGHGSAPSWQEISTGGLTAQVADLIDRVNALENNA